MTTILSLHNEDYSVREFSIYGHAGYSKKGTDIVCAAISCLASTFVTTVEQILEVDKNAFYNFQWIEDAEIPEVRIKLQHSYKKNLVAYGALMMFIIGLQQIANNYPEYVKYEEGVIND